MTPGRVDATVVRRHLLAMQAALQNLPRHRDSTIAELQTNRDRLWAIERGLQLLAQDALDIATHVVLRLPDFAAFTQAIQRFLEK